MAGVNKSDLTFDVEKMYEELHQQCIQQNRVTVAQFAQFEPLLDRDIKSNPNVDAEELTARFMGRFNPFAPIYIFNDITDVQPVQVIQPLFRPVPTCNKVKGGPEALSSFFVSQMKEDHPFRTDALEAERRMKTLITKLSDESEELTSYSELVGANLASNNSPQTADDVDDTYEWE